MKKRNSNLELLRIICMILIIYGHMASQTELMNLKPENGLLYLIWILLGSGSRLAINCFVMIGAYFLVDKSFKSSRVVNLWLQIFSYCGCITLICVITKVVNVGTVRLLQAFLPIFGRPVWFGAEYICLLLLSPFLNRLLRQRYTVKSLLQIFGFLIIVCATLIPIEHTTPAFSELVWFCFLYLLVGYYKLYINKEYRKMLCLILIVLGYGSICGIRIFTDKYIPTADYIASYYVGHYEALPAFMCSIGMFELLKNIKMNHNSNVINFIANAVFPVYLIHQTPVFYEYLWNGIFNIDNYAYKFGGLLYTFMIIIVLYIVAIILENMREKIFRLTVYKSALYNNCCSMIERLYVEAK